MYRVRKVRSFTKYSCLLAAAVTLFPLSLTPKDFRSSFSEGLAISADKTSPAYAAFEALRENFDGPELQIPLSGERLSTGQVFEMPAGAESQPSRLLSLQGMVIRQTDVIETRSATLIAANTNSATTRQPLMGGLHDDRGYLRPLSERRELLLSKLKTQNEMWAQPSPSELARQLTSEELAKLQAAAPAAVEQKIIRSITGTPIIIKGHPGGGPPQAPAPSAVDSAAEDEVYIASLAPRFTNPDNLRPLWLKGQIEMTGGLAFVGPETHIVVKRIHEGRILERGRIWVSEGRFEIHVKHPVGFLVAELQARDGRVLGRGEMNLVLLNDIPYKDNKVTDIRLALRPTADGAAFRAVSGYSHGHQRLPVKNARVEIQNYMDPVAVNEEGMAVEASLSRSSSFVARATAREHWSSLVVGQANHPQDIRLFSNKLVDALIGLELDGMDQKQAYQRAIVWGQVTRDGKPVSGAQVEMAGDYRPIYFNEMYLPDRKQLRTSSNGLFAFLKVRAGVQALRLKSEGTLYPAQIFPTEVKHVSYVELDIKKRRVSQFKIFDIFQQGQPLQARIRLVGADEVLPLDASQLVEYALASDPFMIEAEAGSDYEVTRLTLTGSPHSVNVPLIPRHWYHQLFSELKINPEPGRGTVAGFVDDQDFEVEMTGYGPQERMQIVYFDAQGKILDVNSGVAGGGFMIFNAPPGLQTVYLHPRASRETYSQVVVAEPEYIHTITWSAQRQ